MAINPRSDVTILSQDFQPGEKDVIVGRGKVCYKHSGNIRLAKIVQSVMDAYAAEDATKKSKTELIKSIVNQVRESSPNGGFVKFDADAGHWYEVGDRSAREKVSQTFRDALTDQYKSSTTSKTLKRRQERINRQCSVESKDPPTTMTPSVATSCTLTSDAWLNSSRQSSIGSRDGSSSNNNNIINTNSFSDLIGSSPSVPATKQSSLLSVPRALPASLMRRPPVPPSLSASTSTASVSASASLHAARAAGQRLSALRTSSIGRGVGGSAHLVSPSLISPTGYPTRSPSLSSPGLQIPSFQNLSLRSPGSSAAFTRSPGSSAAFTRSPGSSAAFTRSPAAATALTRSPAAAMAATTSTTAMDISPAVPTPSPGASYVAPMSTERSRQLALAIEEKRRNLRGLYLAQEQLRNRAARGGFGGGPPHL